MMYMFSRRRLPVIVFLLAPSTADGGALDTLLQQAASLFHLLFGRTSESDLLTRTSAAPPAPNKTSQLNGNCNASSNCTNHPLEKWRLDALQFYKAFTTAGNDLFQTGSTEEVPGTIVQRPAAPIASGSSKSLARYFNFSLPHPPHPTPPRPLPPSLPPHFSVHKKVDIRGELFLVDVGTTWLVPAVLLRADLRSPNRKRKNVLRTEKKIRFVCVRTGSVCSTRITVATLTWVWARNRRVWMR